MLKQIAILSLLSALLFSCKAMDPNSPNGGQAEGFLIEDQVATENDNAFETIDSAQEAEALNAQTDAQIETVEVQDRVFFDYDSSEITGEAKKILDVQARWLIDNPNITITIEGHCDIRGTREYNIALGEKRANSAKNYLVSKGVDKSRLKTISYGKEKPAYFGDSAEIHQKNRRAVVVVQ